MSSVSLPIQANQEMAKLYPAPPPHPVSEEDYYKWSESNGYVRAEWVDGEISYMPPVGAIHDDCTYWVGTLLRLYVDRKRLGRVKFDTWTKFKTPRPQVRGPDVLFITADRAGIVTERNVSEPPDFIVEVVSPGDESRDYRDKFLLYEASRVREYWIIDPASESIEAYRLGANGKYARYFEQDEKLTSELVPGWYLRPAWLWQSPQPDVLIALAELGVLTP